MYIIKLLLGDDGRQQRWIETGQRQSVLHAPLDNSAQFTFLAVPPTETHVPM